MAKDKEVPVWVISLTDQNTPGQYYCRRCFNISVDGGAVLVLTTGTPHLEQAYSPGAWYSVARGEFDPATLPRHFHHQPAPFECRHADRS